jgi:hypothetical protein
LKYIGSTTLSTNRMTTWKQRGEKQEVHAENLSVLNPNGRL